MIDLTIVTCCTPNYSVYVGEWARSLACLRTKPKATAIVLAGKDRVSAGRIEAAVKVLEESGIPATWKVIDPCNIGHARNVAVAMADTEWVQHFDVDDLAMPHMLCDVAELTPNADVVALGYRRCGDLKAGPRQIEKLYKSTRGQATLDNRTPCSGVSPFRRRFWEKSPYRTDMAGGWDTALWLGFAYLNARFVATKRPCFFYRQHADSTFNVRRKDPMEGSRVGTKIQSLRRGDSGTSVIVPRAGRNHATRDAAWAWLKQRYQALLPEAEIVESNYTAEPWNKGKAVNLGVEQCHGDVLVIADADCWIDAEALRRAVLIVRSGTAPWVVPHTMVHRFDKATTDRLLAMSPGANAQPLSDNPGYDRVPHMGFAGGGMIVVQRPSFDFVGGFPERFIGWGAEDEAFALILDTMMGVHTRLDNDLWHLHHPIGLRLRSPHYHQNRAIKNQYARAAGDPIAMWAMIKTGTPGRVMGGNVHRFRREQRPAQRRVAA